MPRFRRVIHPSALIHVIVRFLNHDHVLSSEVARAEYLKRVALYFSKSDWRLLSYALMSTHVHFGAITGSAPLASITKPLHCSFAHWLKRSSQGRRLGHVVASRPSSKELPLTAAPILIAYHHNNPVKAGIVERAKDSSWTSHRSYLNGEPPDWLNVELGLALCDLGDSPADRKRFDKLVHERMGTELPDGDEELEAQRRAARKRLGSSIEPSSPRLSPAGVLVADLLAPNGATLHPVWLGALRDIVAMVAKETQISTKEICSKSRIRSTAQARRLFILCAHGELHRPIGEVAAAVGITSASARELEQRATAEDRKRAATLAKLVRQAPLA